MSHTLLGKTHGTKQTGCDDLHGPEVSSALATAPGCEACRCASWLAALSPPLHSCHTVLFILSLGVRRHQDVRDSSVRVEGTRHSSQRPEFWGQCWVPPSLEVSLCHQKDRGAPRAPTPSLSTNSSCLVEPSRTAPSASAFGSLVLSSLRLNTQCRRSSQWRGLRACRLGLHLAVAHPGGCVIPGKSIKPSVLLFLTCDPEVGVRGLLQAGGLSWRAAS